ncbi:MAG: PKD domain-containing protein [Cyclobacteriaceae bacterium]|nr:PKD domain-containing protein [Cyclobacteriaceae bacterium]
MIKGILVMVIFAGLFWSCSKDEDAAPSPVADFSVTVNGQSPNATLQIVNNSTDATTFSWTFGVGASIETSTSETPSGVTVDKSGNLEITLKVENGTLSNSKTLTVTVGGNNAVKTYSDIEFALDAGSTTIGRLFSFDAGKIYKDSEINATVGPTIHLAFGKLGSSVYFFETASVAAYGVPGATVTKVSNFPSPAPILVADFDTMMDDAKLKPLTIEETNESFGNSSIPGVVLFQLASGRKGAIKTKAVNSSRILVDIKIQKY